MRDRRARAVSESRSFNPQSVPEVAAGYFWRARSAVGLGTTGFLVVEGNGHSNFDLVTPTVASQPTLLTENGGVQFRMRPTGDANPSSWQVKPAGASPGTNAAGWSGPTYVGQWVRKPDNGGVITGAGDLIWSHASGSVVRRFSLSTNLTPARIVMTGSSTGTAITTTHGPGILGPNWTWVELVFDPLLILGGSGDVDRLKLFINFVLQVPTATSGTMGTTINDGIAALTFCSKLASVAHANTSDWAAAYYCNGIPTLVHRVRLANADNPSGILLAA